MHNSKQFVRVFRKFLAGSKPVAALVLGSGWSTVVSAFRIIRTLPYSGIPGLGAPNVKGHPGKLHLAMAGSVCLLIFEGRRHFYEGEGWTPVRTMISLCAGAKVKYLFLTNAAGGMHGRMKPGSLMLIKDHINAMGDNPLTGPHDPLWGDRFPDQSEIYDKYLRRLFVATAKSNAIPLRSGVYLATTGPMYETPAEIRAFRRLGADAVGMSTVPEAILANAVGIRVAGLSCITNLASGVSSRPLSHREVIETAGRAQEKMSTLLFKVCAALK